MSADLFVNLCAGKSIFRSTLLPSLCTIYVGTLLQFKMYFHFNFQRFSFCSFSPQTLFYSFFFSVDESLLPLLFFISVFVCKHKYKSWGNPGTSGPPKNTLFGFVCFIRTQYYECKYRKKWIRTTPRF